jgi:hypothetical protein
MKGRLSFQQLAAIVASIGVVYVVSAHYDALKKIAAK